MKYKLSHFTLLLTLFSATKSLLPADSKISVQTNFLYTYRIQKGDPSTWTEYFSNSTKYIWTPVLTTNYSKQIITSEREKINKRQSPEFTKSMHLMVVTNVVSQNEQKLSAVNLSDKLRTYHIATQIVSDEDNSPWHEGVIRFKASEGPRMVLDTLNSNKRCGYLSLLAALGSATATGCFLFKPQLLRFLPQLMKQSPYAPLIAGSVTLLSAFVAFRSYNGYDAAHELIAKLNKNGCDPLKGFITKFPDGSQVHDYVTSYKFKARSYTADDKSIDFSNEDNGTLMLISSVNR